MLIKTLLGKREVEIKHWKTNLPFKTIRNTKKYLLKCDNCNNNFIRKSSGRDVKEFKGHFCSRSCRVKKQQEQTLYKCSNKKCHKEFHRHKKGNKKYCSVSCAQESIHGVKTCSEKNCNTLLSANNKSGLCRYHNAKHRRITTRKRLLAFLGNKCVVCGQKDYMYLTIDHVNNDGGSLRHKESRHGTSRGLLEYAKQHPEDLQILCANCHYAKTFQNDNEIYYPPLTTLTVEKEVS
jgi:hypothetical protein